LHYEKAMTQNCILKKLWHTFGLASKLEFSWVCSCWSFSLLLHG